MAYIRQLLKVKGTRVWSVSPETTVYEAIKKMSANNVGSLLIMTGEALDGILTERHYARNVILKGRASPQTLVREVMATNTICVSPNQDIDDCMKLMTQHRVRHLPVIDQGKVVGIVSIGDLVKFIIDEQRFTIKQLESYISGERMAH